MRGIWERAKADGLNPATNPGWTAVANLCDLTRDLWSTAAQPQLERQPTLAAAASDAPASRPTPDQSTAANDPGAGYTSTAGVTGGGAA